MGLVEEYIRLEEKRQQPAQEFKELFDALPFKFRQGNNMAINEYQSDHWAVTRIAQHLQRCTYVDNHAKHIATKIFDHQKAVDDTEPDSWLGCLPSECALNPTEQNFKAFDSFSVF